MKHRLAERAFPRYGRSCSLFGKSCPRWAEGCRVADGGEKNRQLSCPVAASRQSAALFSRKRRTHSCHKRTQRTHRQEVVTVSLRSLSSLVANPFLAGVRAELLFRANLWQRVSGENHDSCKASQFATISRNVTRTRQHCRRHTSGVAGGRSRDGRLDAETDRAGFLCSGRDYGDSRTMAWLNVLP